VRIAPYLTIVGCTKNYDGTTQEQQVSEKKAKDKAEGEEKEEAAAAATKKLEEEAVPAEEKDKVTPIIAGGSTSIVSQPLDSRSVKTEDDASTSLGDPKSAKETEEAEQSEAIHSEVYVSADENSRVEDVEEAAVSAEEKTGSVGTATTVATSSAKGTPIVETIEEEAPAEAAVSAEVDTTKPSQQLVISSVTPEEDASTSSADTTPLTEDPKSVKETEKEAKGTPRTATKPIVSQQLDSSNVSVVAKKEAAAATTIKKAVRERLIARKAAKKEAKKVAAEEAATTIIQAAFRKHKAKQDFAKKQAATTIQKVGRGYLAWKKAAVGTAAKQEEAKETPIIAGGSTSIAAQQLDSSDVPAKKEVETPTTTPAKQLGSSSVTTEEDASTSSGGAAAPAEEETATAIKKAARGLIARKAEEAKREAEAKKKGAATTIQAFLIKHKAKQDFANKKQAAIAIQKVGRGYLARQQPEAFAKKKKSATTIQASVRGLQARKAFAKAIRKRAREILALVKKVADRRQQEECLQARKAFAKAIRKRAREILALVKKVADRRQQEEFLPDVAKLFMQAEEGAAEAVRQAQEDQAYESSARQIFAVEEGEAAGAEETARRAQEVAEAKKKENEYEPASELSETEATDETERTEVTNVIEEEDWENVPDACSSQQGKKYIAQIFAQYEVATTKVAITKEQGAAQEAVASIVNYLFEEAQKKGQELTEGTFMIEDPDGRFFSFLKNLGGSYQRISSHAIGKPMSQHYGFDLPQGWIKHSGKKHILFFSTEMEGKQKLFLKPENYGTKEWEDFLAHGVEYLESLAKRKGLIASVPDPSQNHRKERTQYLEPAISKACHTCIALIADGNRTEQPAQGESTLDGEGTSGFCLVEDGNKLQEQFEKLGISCLTNLLSNEKIEPSKELKTALEALEKEIKKENLDHLDQRVAKEVIFTKEELIGSSAVATTADEELLQEDTAKKVAEGSTTKAETASGGAPTKALELQVKVAQVQATDENEQGNDKDFVLVDASAYTSPEEVPKALRKNLFNLGLGLGKKLKKISILFRKKDKSSEKCNEEESHTDSFGDEDDEEDYGDVPNRSEHGDLQEGDVLPEETPVTLDAGERLKSEHMRSFIRNNFIPTSADNPFKSVEKTFQRGGLTKSVFWSQESTSGTMTYVALANDQEESQSNAYKQSGEQSLLIVLKEIKSHIAMTKKYSFRILIPLQQIDKEHWTLLAIISDPNNKSKNNASTITATHYDSKAMLSASGAKDNIHSLSCFFSQKISNSGISYVQTCVKKCFEAEMKKEYTGKQILSDSINCGRYTLLKLGELLNLANAPRSKDEINAIFSPLAKKEEAVAE
jgi:hypothetical protein